VVVVVVEAAAASVVVVVLVVLVVVVLMMYHDDDLLNIRCLEAPEHQEQLRAACLHHEHHSAVARQCPRRINICARCSMLLLLVMM
jgi:hypothetical protein